MKTTTKMHDHATSTRLIVRVLQDVIRGESFANYGDLAEALKARCAHLRIPYDAGLISAAIDRVELGGKTPLIELSILAQRKRQLVEREPEPDPIPRADAAVLFAALQLAVKKIPSLEAPGHEQRLRAQCVAVQREAYVAERQPQRARDQLDAIFSEET